MHIYIGNVARGANCEFKKCKDGKYIQCINFSKVYGEQELT